MKTIWKYVLPTQERVTLQMPDGAKVLTAGEQQGDLVLWALVDPNAPLSNRHFHICSTGHSTALATKEGYVGTVQTWPLGLVWHIFEQ